MDSTSRSGARFTPRLGFGLFVVAAGVLLTLDNMGVVRLRHVWDWWPGVFVALGLWMAAESRGARRVFGLTVALLAGLVLLDNLDAFDFDAWELWPLALVLLGAAMVWNAASRSRSGGAVPAMGAPGAATGAGLGDPDSYVRAFALFSTVHRAVTARDFRGGELSAFFGSCEIDLRQAAIAGTATLDVASVFGNVHIRVPLEWTVSVDGGFVGGIEVQTQRPASAGATLRIQGFAPLANVKITN